MRRKLKPLSFIIFLVISVLICSGCWDALAISDRDICTTAILDKKGGLYFFYAEIQQLRGSQAAEQGNTSGAGKTVNVKGSGSSMAEARYDLDNKLNKPIFLGAVQALLITRSMAEEGIEEYFYRLRDTQEYRKTVHMAVISASPEELLGITPENAESIGFAIEQTIETEIELGRLVEISLEDALQKMYSKNRCYLLNELDIEDGHLFVSGVSIFHGGKCIGSIEGDRCRGISYISEDMSKKPRLPYIVQFNNSQITIEAECIKRNIKAEYGNGRISFTLDMGFNGIELYPSTTSPITSEDEARIGQILSDLILEDLTNVIEASQKEFKSDYFGFSEYFRIKYPNEFEGMNWDDEFLEADFNINVEVKVKMDESMDYSRNRVP